MLPGMVDRTCDRDDDNPRARPQHPEGVAHALAQLSRSPPDRRRQAQPRSLAITDLSLLMEFPGADLIHQSKNQRIVHTTDRAHHNMGEK